MRKQQYSKVLKHYSKIELVDMVYELGYSFDYQSELLEYSPRERYCDYAINHAHDVATANNNSDELWECTKEYLYLTYEQPFMYTLVFSICLSK